MRAATAPPAPAPAVRPSPSAEQLASVERAIRRMRDHLGETQCLTDHAEAGLFSPFHFHRVFRGVTAVTPARFLAALRMAEAQRMMIRGSPRVTDVCTAVGYASLGTFTTQFTRLVGMSPSRFKALVDRHGDRGIGEVVDASGLTGPNGPTGPGRAAEITGRATGTAPADAVLFTGLFPHGVPQDLPVACAVTAATATVRLRPPADADHHVLAVCFDRATRVADALDDPAGAHRSVATTRAPTHGSFRLRLRTPALSDPPIVLALPLLLARDATNRATDTALAAKPG
ncbi:AraC family transcriptional regulator [Streptomyces hesseae]|uniref:AraC family transcriptional regulator n=1 Tax=Streptomyces hesseae TaxID=3075519 RepID=A0ABU2SX87_9ACTN|nr:AraC family transcriptional regulator [Streptomyces sp. DSM 40473]MDT0453617.1 AraC family transcriptional regulator [Streptomyces sp. DSM 40473]